VIASFLNAPHVLVQSLGDLSTGFDNSSQRYFTHTYASFLSKCFASKVRSGAWKRSVPPAVAGGCAAVRRLCNHLVRSTLFIDSTDPVMAAHPPATAGGTDPVQLHFLTFGAKPSARVIQAVSCHSLSNKLGRERSLLILHCL
jgi:hypothetical protein